MTLRLLSVLFAIAAVVAMVIAVAGMVRGDQSPARGWLLRSGALVSGRPWRSTSPPTEAERDAAASVLRAVSSPAASR